MNKKVIYKYELKNFHKSTIMAPKGAIFLKVNFQNRGIFIWFLIDEEEKEEEEREFFLATTSNPFEEGTAIFLDTIFNDARDFVMHVFELK